MRVDRPLNMKFATGFQNFTGFCYPFVVIQPENKTVGLPAKRQPSAALSEDDMVRQLQATGRYRILKKLEPRIVAAMPRPGFPLTGIILDTETTGLNYRKDEIIEIGAIAFTFDETGNIGDVNRERTNVSFRFKNSSAYEPKTAKEKRKSLTTKTDTHDT